MVPRTRAPSARLAVASRHGSLASALSDRLIRSPRSRSPGLPGALRRLDLQHGHVDLLAQGEHVLGPLDARVAELADVQHALDAADVDERAERLEPDDLAAQHRAGLELLARLGRQPLLLLLDERAPRQDEVARLVARDAERQPLADVRREVLDEPRVELRRGAEAAHAGHVHRDAALDDLLHHALDGDAELLRLLELRARSRGRARP